MVVLELGWGVDGPMRVAAAGARAQRRILALSLATKAVCAVPAALLAGGLVALVPNAHPLAAILVGASSALMGLSSSWFFIGLGKPYAALMTDPVARLLGTTFACLVAVLSHSLPLFACVLVATSLLLPLITVRATGLKAADFRGLTARRILRAIRSQGAALGGRAATSLYIALPVVLVGIAAPQAVPVFATVERLQRMTLQFLNAIPNALQSWVGRARGTERRSRSDTAIALSAVYGLIAAITFALGAPSAADVLLRGEVELDHIMSSLGGLLILITSVSRATGGISLVAEGRIKVLSLSAVCGALVGPFAILFLAACFGVLGGQLGEVAAEIVVLFVQAVALFVFRRRLR